MNYPNCTEHMALACMAIHSSLLIVKSLFYGRELFEIYFSYKEEKDLLLEIRFDILTQLCLFDDDSICEGIFLFFNDRMDINYYMEHCNMTYPYNRVFKGWVFNNCLIQSHIDDEECGLLILPIQRRCHKSKNDTSL